MQPLALALIQNEQRSFNDRHFTAAEYVSNIADQLTSAACTLFSSHFPHLAEAQVSYLRLYSHCWPGCPTGIGKNGLGRPRYEIFSTAQRMVYRLLLQVARNGSLQAVWVRGGFQNLYPEDDVKPSYNRDNWKGVVYGDDRRRRGEFAFCLRDKPALSVRNKHPLPEVRRFPSFCEGF